MACSFCSLLRSSPSEELFLLLFSFFPILQVTNKKLMRYVDPVVEYGTCLICSVDNTVTKLNIDLRHESHKT
jgi:hypothetical protein